MKLIDTSLKHKILYSEKPGVNKYPALIMLHGRGADEDDLLDLSEYLDDRLFFISARAPFQFQFSGYTWYDLIEIGKPEPKMFLESYQKLVQFHHDIKQHYPVDPTKLFYFGFSMGTVMSFAISLSIPSEVSGIIANSGYIPENSGLSYKWNELKNCYFFVGHGIYDPIIPIEMGRRARFLLEQANANLFYREYQMAHQISEESLNDISQWLIERIECQDQKMA